MGIGPFILGLVIGIISAVLACAGLIAKIGADETNRFDDRDK